MKRHSTNNWQPERNKGKILSVLRNSQVYVYLDNVSLKFINQSVRHSFLQLSRENIIFTLNYLQLFEGNYAAGKRDVELIKLSRISCYKK